MKATGLIFRSLIFYRRSHLGVVLGAAVSTMVLVGALAVGDSVRFSLRQLALTRLGDVQLAMATGERLFRDELADDVAAELHCPVAPVLQVNGIAIRPDESVRANGVRVLGVDERFWRLGNVESPFGGGTGDEIMVSAALAERLAVSKGDTVLLRVSKPSLMPRDAPLGTDADASVAFQTLTFAMLASIGAMSTG